MRIGVLGGTFDPIHNGHLAVAEETRDRLGLAEILFVPASCPRLRLSGPVASAQHRVQMVHLAITGKPYYKLSTVEIERPSTSCSVDTIAALRGQLGREAELFLILGWDSLAKLPEWREPVRLVKMCSLAVVPRPGYPHPDLGSLEAAIPGLAESLILLDAPHVDISASEIRQRVSRGMSIRHLVPEPVEGYIREHGLYATID